MLSFYLKYDHPYLVCHPSLYLYNIVLICRFDLNPNVLKQELSDGLLAILRDLGKHISTFILIINLMINSILYLKYDHDHVDDHPLLYE